MHVPARQTMPIGQRAAPASAAAPGMHWTQRSRRQLGVVPLQSEDWAHSTHRDVAVSQTGAAIVVQPALLVHPARHVKVLASQIGVVVPQSELARQATHVWVAT
jgi:hypothetical protein